MAWKFSKRKDFSFVILNVVKQFKRGIMTSKIEQALTGGIIGTAVMTVVVMAAPMMGMPKMNPPEMLSILMGLPMALGWIMHFVIGIVFSMAYAFFFVNVVKGLSSNIFKGAIFGLAVFIFGQIIMAIMGIMRPMPPMEGSIILMMVGSIIGHIIFGIIVAFFVKERDQVYS